MLDYGLFRFASKQELLDKSIRYWNPGQDQVLAESRHRPRDRRARRLLPPRHDGRRLIDLHLNGGTYNLGHRHPELVETLQGALDYFDIGNHWFPSVARTALAEALVNGLARA